MRAVPDSEISFDVVDPLGDEAQEAMRRYFAELDERFPGGFDPGDGATVGAGMLGPPTGAFVVVRAGGAVAGCGGVQRLDERTAEIKRMWIDPAHRGAGLARRLLTELEGHARRLGHARVVLDTNGTLLPAIALYESSGYHPTERYNDNPYAERWFRKEL